jgi:hypothetical protein
VQHVLRITRKFAKEVGFAQFATDTFGYLRDFLEAKVE